MLSKDLFGKIHVTPQPVGESVPVQMSRKPENPNQYKLFMRPQELMDTIRHSVDEGDAPYAIRQTKDRSLILNDMWDRKDKELNRLSHKGLVSSVEKHGILRPVTIEDQPEEPLRMGNGHHRVAAALRVEKNTGRQVYIPVVYDRNWNHTDEYPVTTDAERAYRKIVR